MAKTFRYLIALLILLPSGALFAQEDKEPVYTIEFAVYSRGSGDWDGIYYLAEPGAPVELDLYRGGRSPVYTYTGPQKLTFFRISDGPDGQPIYTPVASTKIDPTIRRGLAFLTPGKSTADEGKEFNLSMMPDTSTAVPAEHLVFYNATGAVLVGVVDKEKVVLESGVSDPISTRDFQDGDDVLIGLTVKYQDTFKVVLETLVRFYPNRRNLIVLLPPEKEGSFEIVAFRLDERVR